MELGASISVSVLAGRELAEVAGGYWYNVVIELEYDTAFIFVVNCNIELVDCDGESASIPYLAVEEKGTTPRDGTAIQSIEYSRRRLPWQDE